LFHCQHLLRTWRRLALLLRQLHLLLLGLLRLRLLLLLRLLRPRLRLLLLRLHLRLLLRLPLHMPGDCLLWRQVAIVLLLNLSETLLLRLK
jgi:hypothetical protein